MRKTQQKGQKIKLRMSSRKKMENLRKSECQSRRSNSLILEREREWEEIKAINQEKCSALKNGIPNKGAQSVGKTSDKNKL